MESGEPAHTVKFQAPTRAKPPVTSWEARQITNLAPIIQSHLQLAPEQVPMSGRVPMELWPVVRAEVGKMLTRLCQTEEELWGSVAAQPVDVQAHPQPLIRHKVSEWVWITSGVELHTRKVLETPRNGQQLSRRTSSSTQTRSWSSWVRPRCSYKN